MRHSRLVRSRRSMAVLTGELGVVCRIDMAIRADCWCTLRWVRKPEKGMVENRAHPGRGHVSRMTSNASCRIVSSYVIRCGR